MIKFLANFIGNLLELLNKIFNLIGKKEFKYFLLSKLKSNLYIHKEILNNSIKFYIPSTLSRKRVEKNFSKEPGTIEWINNFSSGEKIFWDIGANIGLFSIYSVLKHKNLKTFAFEPSFLNLDILSKNISSNNLSERIKKIPLRRAGTVKEISFFVEQLFNEEASFIAGSTLTISGGD